jgi:hypothetical protein
MQTIPWVLAVGFTMASLGCSSTIEGGGSGSGGGGGSGGAGVTTSGTQTTTGTQATTTTTTGTQTTSSGVGGGNALGNCESNGGSAVTTSGGGTTSCESDYSCDGGAVQVTCTSSAEGEQCDCYLGGGFAGSCTGEAGCSFPQSCCFALLGGTAEPNPGPYGACEQGGGTVSSSGSGGEAVCMGDYACEGGSMTIECTGTEAGATCECKDAQSFVIGTCQQPSLSCDYLSNCCCDILN